ncbi:MAG TPA: PTS sugar transporter subunit IIA [Anaerolineales bacterium]|nr:PTS sugar transporter subunit IIA [Anaerolineales bacterium]
MQYTLTDLLKPEHILIRVEAVNAQDAIRKLSAALVDSGHVTPEFADDVWKRELTFPTGLPTQPLAVAIPHADPDHVSRSAVCIGVLTAPLHFAQMGTNGATVLDVRLIFLLAIKEREKQVELIQQLISLIQNGSLLEGLAEAKDPAEAMALIKRTLT